MKYLSNTFSPNMLKNDVSDLKIIKIDKEAFCSNINDAVNSIGHEGTVKLVNTLCNTDLKMNRIPIKMDYGDDLYVVTLNFRVEEGKVYTYEELKGLYEQGKIVFYHVYVLNQ